MVARWGCDVRRVVLLLSNKTHHNAPLPSASFRLTHHRHGRAGPHTNKAVAHAKPAAHIQLLSPTWSAPVYPPPKRVPVRQQRTTDTRTLVRVEVEVTMSADMDAAPTPIELQQYITAQTAGFYAFLHQAVNEYGETGKLPAAVFSATGKSPRVKGGRKKDPSQPKRGMSAFNFYVQKRISELRDNGFVPDAETGSKSRGMLGQAVKDWKSMSAGQRESFVAEFKRTHGAGAEQPAAPAAVTCVLCCACSVKHVTTYNTGLTRSPRRRRKSTSTQRATTPTAWRRRRRRRKSTRNTKRNEHIACLRRVHDCTF